jgi:hypothetical protein
MTNGVTPVDAVSPQSRACHHRKRRNPQMSIAKKIAHKAKAAKGAAKKYFGRATGNTRLRTETPQPGPTTLTPAADSSRPCTPPSNIETR